MGIRKADFDCFNHQQNFKRDERLFSLGQNLRIQFSDQYVNRSQFVVAPLCKQQTHIKFLHNLPARTDEIVQR